MEKYNNLTKGNWLLSTVKFEVGKRDEEKTAITTQHNNHMYIYCATIKKAQNATQKREYYAYMLILFLSTFIHVCVFYINKLS